MRTCILNLAIIVFATFSELLTVAAQDIRVERATAEEARSVQEVSAAFERRMKETRDAGSLKDLFLTDFMRVQIEQEKASHPEQSLSFIPALPVSIERDLTERVTEQDWERLYFAGLNLRYYFVLLIASRVRAKDFENGKQDLRQIFPADVLTVLHADPFLRKEYGAGDDNNDSSIKTVPQLRAFISTLEKATLRLRHDFAKHPPEQTAIYQENLRQTSHTETTGEPVIQPDVTEESRLGFPPGTRFFHRLTLDSMFELWLVKTATGMRIVWARVYPFN